MLKYKLNPQIKIDYNGVVILSANEVLEAIYSANEALKKLNETTMEFDINIFEILGMRNLSGMVGEYFARCVMKVSKGKLQSNLHQDGYPDLLLTDTKAKRNYFDSLYTVDNGRKYPISKEVFSPYKFGGIEVKATCGSTPPASKVAKPLIGEQRIRLLNSFDWKAHHRDTNHLLAILWDFIDCNPTIVGCFFQNSLTQDDWGEIVQPKKDGGRTTSVSIMNSYGIKKMCTNWVAILDNPLYIEKLSNHKWIGYKV